MQTSPISYLIHVAEEQKEEARHALEVDELNAEERFREWTKMLELLYKIRDHGTSHVLTDQ